MLKDSIIQANRSVKDHVEYQGRMQVKIINSNLLTKCDYYLREFTSKGSKFKELILNSGHLNKNNADADIATHTLDTLVSITSKTTTESIVH